MDSINIPITGESAGLVEISISEGAEKGNLLATFTYTPDESIGPPEKMLLQYRDNATDYSDNPIDERGRPLNWIPVAMTQETGGRWTASRTIGLNESSDFCMHPNIEPHQLFVRPNIINKIALMDGRLIKEVYENPALAETDKGHLGLTLRNLRHDAKIPNII